MYGRLFTPPLHPVLPQHPPPGQHNLSSSAVVAVGPQTPTAHNTPVAAPTSPNVTHSDCTQIPATNDTTCGRQLRLTPGSAPTVPPTSTVRDTCSAHCCPIKSCASSAHRLSRSPDTHNSSFSVRLHGGLVSHHSFIIYPRPLPVFDDTTFLQSLSAKESAESLELCAQQVFFSTNRHSMSGSTPGKCHFQHLLINSGSIVAIKSLTQVPSKL